MPLAARVQHAFRAVVRERGRDYARWGHVAIAAIDENAAEAHVRGSTRQRYLVRLGASAGRSHLRVSCSCPHFERGEACKHLWATLLALDAQGWAPRGVPSGSSEELPTWACMEAAAAEALSALPDLSADPDGAEDSLATDSARVANACAAQGPAIDRPTPALPVAEPTPAIDALLDGLDDADAFEFDARLRRAVALEQRLDAELAPLLRRFPLLWEQLGISPRKMRALVRLDRAGDRCPALSEAFQDGRLSWVQAHALVGLLSLPETAPFRDAWVAWAERVTVRRLQEDADAALEAAARGEAPAPPDDPSWQMRAEHRGDEETPALAEETARFFFSAPAEVARLLRAVICSVRRCLECSEGAAWGWLFDHALEAWGANDPRIRREHRVFARDGWRCTVPGCTSYRNLHDHHIVFRSVGGDDDIANRTTLCAYHHLRGVHAGRVRVIGSAPDELRFELGLRPGRPPLLRYASGDRFISPSSDPGTPGAAS